jgi:hypothetical protein
MPGIAERLSWIMNLGRRPVGWAVGAVAVAVVAALLWFGLAASDGGRYAGTATPSSASSDILPPPEEDADHATAAGAADQSTRDIIPPDEP